jgi:hypothetical protein
MWRDQKTGRLSSAFKGTWPSAAIVVSSRAFYYNNEGQQNSSGSDMYNKFLISIESKMNHRKGLRVFPIKGPRVLLLRGCEVFGKSAQIMSENSIGSAIDVEQEDVFHLKEHSTIWQVSDKKLETLSVFLVKHKRKNRQHEESRDVNDVIRWRCHFCQGRSTDRIKMTKSIITQSWCQKLDLPLLSTRKFYPVLFLKSQKKLHSIQKTEFMGRWSWFMESKHGVSLFTEHHFRSWLLDDMFLYDDYLLLVLCSHSCLL